MHFWMCARQCFVQFFFLILSTFSLLATNHFYRFPQHCRQPMQFLSFFKEHQTKEAFGVEVLPVGAYVLPTFCEYCHAANTSQCSADCRRPALYFQKKRPPFAKPDSRVWDPVTDAHRPPPSPQMTTSTLRQSSWLSMFSHSDGGD